MIDIKHILHPTDFSELARRALPYVLEFARKYDSRIDLLHVLELPFGAISMAEEAIANSERQVEGLIPREDRANIEIVPFVVRGKPSTEICRIARERETDLIVLATHGHSGLEHAVLGSTAERVVRKAPCPVLTIRHPEHEFVHE